MQDQLFADYLERLEDLQHRLYSVDSKRLRIGGRKADVAWQVCENDNEWETVSQAGENEASVTMATQGHSPYCRLLPLLLLGSLLLILVMANLRWQAQEHKRAVAAQKETPTAQVQPVVDQRDLHKSTGMEWLGLPVSESYLGESQRLETRHFIYLYYPDDAQAVAEVAAQFDAIFVELQQLYLGHSSTGAKRVVVVDPLQSPGRMSPRTGVAEPLLVASPAAFTATEEISAGEVLAQSLLLVLLDDLAAQVVLREQYHGTEPIEVRQARLGQVLRGAKLWHLWRSELPLSTWREPVVQWLYGDVRAWRTAKGDVTPDVWPDLCAMYSVWMVTPMDIGIPTTCGPLGAEKHYFMWRRVHAPAWELAQIPLYVQDSFFVADAQVHPAATVVMATLIEYAAATYGAERVPLLLENFSGHQEWESLIPMVFDVSAVEFEAGWRSYVAQQYKRSLAR